ncbi:MAG: hypothetical protein ACJATT_005584 [Myxococcota bacterium]|jgi:hypothetical protein
MGYVMSRFFAFVVVTTTCAAPALGGGPGATPSNVSSTAALSTKPTSDATVRVHPAKRDHSYQRPACRLSPHQLIAPDTGGQYIAQRHPEGTSVSMTLLHPLWTTSWVTPMARQLAQLDEDVVSSEAVDITLLLANNDIIELMNVGLEVGPPLHGMVRASTHVRLPRHAVDALAASPVVQVTWTLDGVPYHSSLSRHQGQRWYQQPFTCIAASLP